MNFLKQTRTISITSGKGGVGKTILVCNMAVGLAQKGQRVLIFDADLGMANVDLFFGVKAQGHIGEVIEGQKDLADVLIEVAKNVYLIPGGNGIVELQHMNHFQKRAMLESIEMLPMSFDTIIIDTAPGLADHVLYFNSVAESNFLVLTPDPSSFADGYSLVKVLHQQYKKKRFSVIVNQVADEREGLLIFSKFQDIVAQFLHIRIDFLGTVSFDSQLKRAVQAQRLILRQSPGAISSRGILEIVNQIEQSGLQSRDRVSNRQFWSQVVGIA
jgi:flagellar biosynthesis protein FlhG